ncbi:PREDICTED: interleukin-17 receptor A isoform X1 [Sturnus vulgaris]|uniref:interleukin-17 receptor A isoform X1 n=1 Tax=Sturnus vulgaris TaxID=9172 RepID=UPI00071A7189|nr:PREDICTED: interleukin-17 receptor A isoform X1 [Sturnus vulgaris]
MAGAGPPLPLLFLLLLLLPRPAAALRLLLDAAPPFTCSQPDLNCLVRNSTCMESSWLNIAAWTPSAPSSLHVSSDVFRQEDGKLFPVLHIEWKVATDASIRTLEGAELAVMQVNSNQQICAQFDFQNNLPLQVRPDGGRWNFTFDRFEVEPGQTYQVTVYHLPKLGVNGDRNCKSTSLTMPGCMDSRMKRTIPCIKTGSLWEPRIRGESLDDTTLLVSFNPWMEPARYQIHVASYLNEKRCKMTTKDFTEDGLQQQVNVTIKMDKNIKACCHYKIQIQPFFANCGTDCLRHSASVPCKPVPSTEPSGDMIWLYWCITGICVLLVVSVITAVLCMTKIRAGRRRGKWNHNNLQAAPYTELSLPPLKPRKVWIVYSADHLLYVDVVLRFAEFLMTVCGTAVALDLLEDHHISELGPLPWLTRQKKEMEELSSKIIILCSRGTQAKWQAMLGSEPVCLKQDQQKPVGDLFTPALNLILPDFKKPACFGMYIVCYFEGISSERDIPDLFNVTSRYQLMDKFEDIYFRIQDLEKFEPGRIHRIQEITAENYIDTPSGRKLKEAIDKFKNWQTEHPDWFESETICLDSDEELHSLNRESQVDSLLSEPSGIVKHQLHLREPDPHCCYVISLHMHEGESTGCKLQPQLNPCGDPNSQTVVLPVDVPRIQVVEPVSSVEDRNILSHHVLSNEDCMEGVPLLETSFPMRNNVILHDGSEVSVADQSPANFSDDLSDHLNELMYPLYQQSVIPSEPEYLCQGEADQQHQLVFDDQCKDQRQSVQSDQGYISRCSPLPPEDLLEEEEEEEEEHQEQQVGFHELSPEVLNSLKSLQKQLFFQDIQRSSSWSYPAEVMDIDQSLEDC